MTTWRRINQSDRNKKHYQPLDLFDLHENTNFRMTGKRIPGAIIGAHRTSKKITILTALKKI